MMVNKVNRVVNIKRVNVLLRITIKKTAFFGTQKVYLSMLRVSNLIICEIIKPTL